MIEHLKELHKHFAPLAKGELPVDLVTLADEVKYGYSVLAKEEAGPMSRQIACVVYAMWRIKTGRIK
jgi:hypothetical protein